MHDLDLPRRLRLKGLNVQLVGGWDTRGSSTFSPVGSINHHTAGSALGVAPSLNTCIYGRPDVPGPLCNVLQGRHQSDPMLDPVFVIAAGKANHGGQGSWRGVSGNSKYYGLEIEHVGTVTVDPRRLEVAARIHAAFLEATPDRDAEWTPQHFEYAEPPGRKIDFFNLSPLTAASFRSSVAYWIGRSANQPPDPGPLPEDDYMPTVKFTIPPAVEGGVQVYAYLLPDGTLLDKDYNLGAIDGNDAIKFDKILLAKAEDKPRVSQAEVDQVQQAIQYATRQRLNTL